MRWIKVSDELPSIDTEVLCLFKCGCMDVCKYTMVFKLELVANCICYTEQITHWMPLPKPPKQ